MNNNNDLSNRTGILLLSLLTLGFVASAMQTALAQAPTQVEAANDEASLAFRVGGGYTDNVRRIPGDEESASYSAIGAEFGLAHDSRRVAAALTGDVEQRSYSEEGVDDEVYGTFDGSVELQAVLDRFSWLFANSYGQTRSDPFRIDSPVNREYINVASTGPRLTLPLGSRSMLRVSGTLGKRSYEDTSLLDSDARTVDIGVERAISNRAGVSVTISERQVEYDALPFRDNDVRNTYVGYQSRLSSGSAAVSLGTSQVDFGAEDSSTPYVSLSWQRDVGARSSVSLTASNELVDTGQDFMSVTPSSIDLDRLNDVLLSPDVYRRSSAGVAYRMVFSRTTLSFGGSMSSQQYENDTALENDQRSFDIGLSRQLSPATDVGVNAYVAMREFDASGQEDDDTTMRLWWNKQFASRFSLELAYQRDERDSVLGFDYGENSIRLLLEVDLRSRGR